MGQLCCFPFSQAEEKISKCVRLLSAPRGCVCVVGETNRTDLLGAGVHTEGRQHVPCVASCQLSAFLIVCDPQMGQEGVWGKSECATCCCACCRWFVFLFCFFKNGFVKLSSCCKINPTV